jgi:hypothetical protein
MDLNEITSLMQIRQYVVNSTGNPTIDKATVNFMNGLLIMLDKKIINILKSDDFKNYVNYQDVRAAIEEVARITNIKSSIKK